MQDRGGRIIERCFLNPIMDEREDRREEKGALLESLKTNERGFLVTKRQTIIIAPHSYLTYTSGHIHPPFNGAAPPFNGAATFSRKNSMFYPIKT